jgi:hypothetical protein
MNKGISYDRILWSSLYKTDKINLGLPVWRSVNPTVTIKADIDAHYKYK